MDTQTQNYRQGQFNQLKPMFDYPPTIKIFDGEGNKTHCLSITKDEFLKIRAILLNENYKG
jgi:hypothetical protein